MAESMDWTFYGWGAGNPAMKWDRVDEEEADRGGALLLFQQEGSQVVGAAAKGGHEERPTPGEAASSG